jgi:hypothetical protein
MKYGNRAYPQSLYSGNANIFALACDPTKENVVTYTSSDGLSVWAIFTLPGGSKIAFGGGQEADGGTIYVPSEVPWITASNMLSIVSVQGGNGTGRGVGGVNAAGLSGLTMNASYRNYDSPDTWEGIGSWIAVAWMPGRTTISTLGGTWVEINLGKGTQIAFGAGSIADGSSFSLPGGYTQSQMLSIGTPASFNDNHDNCLHAVSNCDIAGTTAQLTYVDGSGNSWNGNVNWFAFAWENA